MEQIVNKYFYLSTWLWIISYPLFFSKVGLERNLFFKSIATYHQLVQWFHIQHRAFTSEITTWWSLGQYSVILQNSTNSYSKQTGKVSGDMMETTTPTSFRFLRVALIFAVSAVILFVIYSWLGRGVQFHRLLRDFHRHYGCLRDTPCGWKRGRILNLISSEEARRTGTESNHIR